MRTPVFSYFLGILTVLILMLIQYHVQYPAPTNEVVAVLADMPNQTESDHRKQATLVVACQSLADLIQSGAITKTDEVVTAFIIETANLRTGKQWLPIQQRIATLLRKAKSIDEQEMLLQRVACVMAKTRTQ